MESVVTPSIAEVEWNYLFQRRRELRQRTLTNRLYQQERQRIMELREGLVKAASLMAGSVALARIVDPQIIIWAVAVIFAGTASSLVFGWGSKARDAAKRAAEWTSIDKDIDAAGERHFTEQQLNEWMARCNEVESSEPAPNRVLLESCHRRACETLGTKPGAGGPALAGWRVPLLIP